MFVGGSNLTVNETVGVVEVCLVAVQDVNILTPINLTLEMQPFPEGPTTFLGIHVKSNNCITGNFRGSKYLWYFSSWLIFPWLLHG